MNPLVIAEVLGYLALVPEAIGIFQGAMNAIQEARNDGRTLSKEELVALADQVRADFEALPKPE